MNDRDDPRPFPSGRPLAGLNSAVLRLLAVGVPEAAIPERMSEHRMPGFSVDDLREILVHARTVTRATSLLPPAQAAFFERTLLPPAGAFGGAPGVDLSASDLEALRSLAFALVDAYLSDDRGSAAAPDPKRDPMHSAALQYVEALLRQEEIIDDLNQASSAESSLHAAITGTDRTRLHELLLNRGGTRLDSLVNRWQRFVGIAESDPQSMGYEEYENWLRGRDLLEDVMSVLSPASREILESRIQPLDESLFRATREVASSIRPPSPWQPQPWWWYRVPTRLGGYFKDRLEHLSPAAARDAFAAPD